MYEILLTEEAKKQLAKLDERIKRKIVSGLERIKIRPHKFVKRLYNSPYYRLRIDNYRIILDIKETQLIIYVIEIGLRGKVYKK